MKFIDVVTLVVDAGSGGSGAVALGGNYMFRREGLRGVMAALAAMCTL